MDEVTVARRLDDVAHWAAGRLDAGDDDAVWQVTKTLEEAAGMRSAGTRPAGPLLARRFAQIHGVLLARAGEPAPVPVGVATLDVVVDRVLCGV